jgi:hypothetical protein
MDRFSSRHPAKKAPPRVTFQYLAKMEFILHGCDVFTSEVDDHGIDFVIRTRAGRHYDVQVQSYRPASNKYVYLQKSVPHLTPIASGPGAVRGWEPAALFLVPSCIDGAPNPILESRDYGEGKKSDPEWGLTLSRKKLALLATECGFSERERFGVTDAATMAEYSI